VDIYPGLSIATREELHAVIDRMPEHTLAAIGRYLSAVEAGMPVAIATGAQRGRFLE
jgi:hypothetical protein